MPTGKPGAQAAALPRRAAQGCAGAGRWRASARPASGFSYLALLFAVALLGISLGVLGQVWHFQAQREREAQLIWVGHQYRHAIELYYRNNSGPGGGAVGAAVAAAAAATGANDAAVVALDPSVLAAQGSAAQGGRYPPSLEALLSDPRYQKVTRYLRRLYADPITGEANWVPILSPNGGVMGVHSVSEDTPIKQGNFAPADIKFTGKQHYTEWAFVFVPPPNQRRNNGATSGPIITGPAPGAVAPQPVQP